MTSKTKTELKPELSKNQKKIYKEKCFNVLTESEFLSLIRGKGIYLGKVILGWYEDSTPAYLYPYSLPVWENDKIIYHCYYMCYGDKMFRVRFLADIQEIIEICKVFFEQNKLILAKFSK